MNARISRVSSGCTGATPLWKNFMNATTSGAYPSYEPTFASPFSPESPDGALVSLQGTVERVTVTETGGHMILRVDGIPVFVPASARGELILLEGDRVAVLGTVQTYRGEKEIVVQGRDDIRVLG